MMLPVVVLVLLCAAMAAQGQGTSEGMGVGAVTWSAALQVSEDDPCGGFCDILGRNCVVTRRGRAFCADCAGLLKPTGSDTGSFAECCKYNAKNRQCVSALRASSVGTCLRSEDLFVRASDPTQASVRNVNGKACGRMVDFLDNGLACRLETGKSGVLRCINSDGTAQAPCSSIGFVQVGAGIDGESNFEHWGESVVMSADGSRVAIGAPNSHEGGFAFSGSVRVFEMLGSEGWVQVGQSIHGESEGDFSGTAIALSADGSRVAIAAAGSEDNGIFSGQVRVFEMLGSDGWVQVGQDIDGESSRDDLGDSVAISADGSRLAIGASQSYSDGPERGYVRVFEMLGSEGWVQVGQDIDGESEGDWSGESVAMSADGSRVAIGAGNNGGNGPFSGHVRVFEMLGGERWVQVGQDIDGEAESDQSGSAVAMSADGSRVAIGARFNGENGSQSGHVRVFEMLGSEGWVQVGQDIDGEAEDILAGELVAMSADGSRVAVRATITEPAGGTRSSGSIRLFEMQGNAGWVQLGENIDGEFSVNYFGTAVAMSADGSRVAIGAQVTNLAVPVRVFEEVRQCQ